jgi:hypothetical protein
MSEILAVLHVRRSTAHWHWLILDCGHWFKWGGQRPRVGDDFPCSACTPLPRPVWPQPAKEPDA